MKKVILLLSGLFFILFSSNINAQDEEEKVDTRPVRSPWNCSMLVDNQTVVAPSKGTLEFIIHHRMGAIKNGTTDLFGIYAASNIRLALQYGVTDKLMVGFGTEKDNKLNEFFWKYAILTQTRGGNIPVSLSYYGNAVIDARDESVFGADYGFGDRLSYFNQFIVSRKFNKDFSAQVAGGYAHINAVEGAKDDANVYNLPDSIYSPWVNSALALSFGAKYDITSTFTTFVEYDMSMPFGTEDYSNDVEPNLAVGFEIATSTHAFQLFVSNYKNIIAQKNHIYNTRALDSDGIGVGFNITVRF
jgi:Membrane bound beta barrel domain (DUF5777)